MHTPGPWEIPYGEAWKDLETKRFSLRVNNAEKGAVAYSQGRTASEATGNAQLIAAAPELLDALQGCADALTEAGKAFAQNNPLAARPNLYEIHAEVARAAIKKAVDNG